MHLGNDTAVAPAVRPPNTSLDGDWRDMVVICAGTSWDGVQGTDKHIAIQLSRHVPVLFVDPPMSWLTPRRSPHLAESLAGPRLRLVRPNLARLTPLTLPGPGRPGIRLVAGPMVRRTVRRAVRALAGTVQANVVAHLDPMFGAADEDVRVLYATDDFVAGAELMNIPIAHLRRQERRQLRRADVVVAVSTTLAERWQAKGIRSVVVPNGVDVSAYDGIDDAPLPADVDLPGPVVGFVGYLSDRIDLALLEAVADTGASLLLVGPRQLSFAIQRIDRLLERPNVRWVGPKPFEELPSYLRIIDVGITPYADTAFNRASFPLKTLEYLAAGRGVVATDLPAARSLDTNLVTLASGSEQFAAEVARALAVPREPELVARRRSFAASHSWEHRAHDLARAIGLPLAPQAD